MIGRKKIEAVSEADVGAIVHSPMRIISGQVVSGRGAAGNLYRLLHHMFAKALVWKMRPRELGNPLEGVTEPKCCAASGC
jgi:hypothetical protein